MESDELQPFLFSAFSDVLQQSFFTPVGSKFLPQTFSFLEVCAARAAKQNNCRNRACVLCHIEHMVSQMGTLQHLSHCVVALGFLLVFSWTLDSAERNICQIQKIFRCGFPFTYCVMSNWPLKGRIYLWTHKHPSASSALHLYSNLSRRGLTFQSRSSRSRWVTSTMWRLFLSFFEAVAREFGWCDQHRLHFGLPM